jgi:hypothetical protein
MGFGFSHVVNLHPMRAKPIKWAVEVLGNDVPDAICHV